MGLNAGYLLKSFLLYILSHTHFSKFQVNYSGYSKQNTNYPSPTQSSRPEGQSFKRSANDNYQASLASGGQMVKRSSNDNYRASLAPGRNSSGNSNNAPLGSVENRGQKRGLGSGKLFNPNWTRGGAGLFLAPLHNSPIQ